MRSSNSRVLKCGSQRMVLAEDANSCETFQVVVVNVAATVGVGPN